MKDNIFTEYGLDFDNNKYGFGFSTEIEKEDDTEYRVSKIIPKTNKSLYFRIWVGKTVVVFSKKGVKFLSKKRNNFKIVFGVAGYNKDYI